MKIFVQVIWFILLLTFSVFVSVASPILFSSPSWVNMAIAVVFISVEVCLWLLWIWVGVKILVKKYGN